MKIASCIGSIFILYSVIITVLGYTVVPVDQFYKRQYLPWMNQSQEITYSHSWNFGDYRDGDALFEHAYDLIETVKQSKNNNLNEDIVITTNTSLGYPLGPGYAYFRGTAIPIAEFLLYFYPQEYEKVAYYSINLSAGFWGFLSFVILWLISYLINGRSWYNLIVAIAANPLIFLNVQENFLMAVTGSLLIGFSIVTLVTKNNIKLSNYIIYFSAFLGSLIIYRSGIFQFYLYIPLLYAILSFYLIKHISFKNYLYVGISIVLAIVIESNFIYWTLDFLKNSNKAMQGGPTSLISRGYAPIPLRSIIEIPTLEPFFNRYLPDYHKYLKIIPGSNIVFGLPLFVLGSISLFKSTDRYLKLSILFPILYWMGPVQYLLSIIIGGPFKTETSIRMDIFVYIFFTFLAVYSLKNNLFNQYKKKIVIFSLIGLFILVSQVITLFILTYFYKFENKGVMIWSSGISQIISIFLFIYFLKKKDNVNQFILATAFILIIPLSNAFFFSGNQALVPYPIAIGVKQNKSLSQSLRKDDVGALIIDSNEKGSSFHPNFWYSEAIRGIHSYRNPFPKEYSQLFWYQYYSNGIDMLKRISSEEELNNNIRNNWLLPIPVYNNQLSIETERFFDLTGVNIIASKQERTIISKGWKMKNEYDGVRIWSRERPFEPIRIACQWNIMHTDFNMIKSILKSDIDLGEVVFLEDTSNIFKCEDNSQINRISIDKNGKTYIDFHGAGGVLVTNFTYIKGWQATNLSTSENIETFRCNYAFLCLKLPKEYKKYNIKINYHRPKLLNGMKKYLF